MSIDPNNYLNKQGLKGLTIYSKIASKDTPSDTKT